MRTADQKALILSWSMSRRAERRPLAVDDADEVDRAVVERLALRRAGLVDDDHDAVVVPDDVHDLLAERGVEQLHPPAPELEHGLAFLPRSSRQGPAPMSLIKTRSSASGVEGGGDVARGQGGVEVAGERGVGVLHGGRR
jgi:hypothetical protein